MWKMEKLPFNTAMVLMVPEYTTVKGVPKKTFAPVDNIEPDDPRLFFGLFRTFGGTESDENGIYTVVDTAKVDTWYRPDITADCMVYIPETGAKYEIIGTPENLGMQHKFLEFRVRKAGK